MESQRSSFLSASVKKVLFSCADRFDNTDVFFEQEIIFNWNVLESVIRECNEVNSFDRFSTEWFHLAVSQLSPVFVQCEHLLKYQDVHDYENRYSNWIQWVSQPDIVKECLRLVNSDEEGEEILSILLLTSVLERSLGDIYLMKGQQCPSMLKDLLISKELEEILGNIIVSLLNVVIGPPKSLNLRNISWHGFLTPGELPKRYIYFLLILIPSIGNLLHKKGLNLLNIPHREYISFQSQCMLETVPIFSNINTFSAVIEQSSFIPKSMQLYWKHIVTYFCKKQYGYSMCLIWPLFENCLRCMFADVNGCSQRVLTAEATTLYTTFNEILSRTLDSEQVNLLIKKIGEPCMDLLMDLLVYPSGPRLRDRLSHGETDVTAFPIEWTEVTINLLFYLAYTYDTTHQCGKEYGEILKPISNYSSYFHPISLLKQKIESLCEMNDSMKDEIKVNPNLETWTIADGYDLFIDGNTEYNSLKEATLHIETLMLQKSSMINKWFCFPFTSNLQYVLRLLSTRLSRPHRFEMQESKDASSIGESEIINLLTKIVMEMTTAVSQLITAVVVREDKLFKKELRSRQRENMKKLLKSVPLVHLSTHMICLLTIHHLCCLHEYVPQELSSLKRLLRTVLQFCENQRTYTSRDKNKWTEATQAMVRHASKLKYVIENESI